MPFFDEQGTRYKEQLEATKTELRLIAGRPEIVAASRTMVQQARLLAAARATHDADALPAERFDELWAAERRFVAAARRELAVRDLAAEHPASA